MVSKLIKSLSKNQFLSLVFALIPASFIAGNLILNLNILIFIIIALIFHWKKIFKINLEFIDKSIIIFFLFISFTGIKFLDLIILIK